MLKSKGYCQEVAKMKCEWINCSGTVDESGLCNICTLQDDTRELKAARNIIERITASHNMTLTAQEGTVMLVNANGMKMPIWEGVAQ